MAMAVGIWEDIPNMEMPPRKKLKIGGEQEVDAVLNLQFLPIVTLSIIFRYLRHSSLLNLSLANKRMRGIIEYELQHDHKLWFCLHLKPWMSQSCLNTLRKALARKAQHIKIIIVINADNIIMSGTVFDFILNFHDISALRIESKISIPFILRYISVFQESEFLKCLNCKKVFGKRIQKVEFLRLNISVQRMINSVEYSNIAK